MELHLFFDPETADFVLLAREGDYRGRSEIVRGEGGRLEWKLLPATGVSSGPILRTGDQRFWHALGAKLKAMGFVPKDADDAPAVKAHLEDVKSVRDRLLSIVERSKP